MDTVNANEHSRHTVNPNEDSRHRATNRRFVTKPPTSLSLRRFRSGNYPERNALLYHF
ncbi:MAG: hypothetical protein JXR70_06305 [Spirochaetales bacterium]|nr:hypothetical protein [Spirochaetales bacterium]